MQAVVLSSARLDLILQTPDELLALVAAMPLEDRAEVSPDWLARIRSTSTGDPWALGFTVVEREAGAVVGNCGFKGPPDAEGVVEIAYGIESGRRGRGYATEAAETLTRFAFADRRVIRVYAHTRPEGAASARVLMKCGFRRIGEVDDPEDGLVHRWERTREVSRPG